MLFAQVTVAGLGPAIDEAARLADEASVLDAMGNEGYASSSIYVFLDPAISGDLTAPIAQLDDAGARIDRFLEAMTAQDALLGEASSRKRLIVGVNGMASEKRCALSMYWR